MSSEWSRQEDRDLGQVTIGAWHWFARVFGSGWSDEIEEVVVREEEEEHTHGSSASVATAVHVVKNFNF